MEVKKQLSIFFCVKDSNNKCWLSGSVIMYSTYWQLCQILGPFFRTLLRNRLWWVTYNQRKLMPRTCVIFLQRSKPFMLSWQIQNFIFANSLLHLKSFCKCFPHLPAEVIALEHKIVKHIKMFLQKQLYL